MPHLDFGVIGSAGLGSIAQEVVWLFNLRRSLDDADKAVLKSLTYWLIMAGWLVFASLMAIVLFHGGADITWREAFTLGAGLPLIVKTLSKAGLPGQHLGASTGDRRKLSLRKYLRA